MAGERRRRRYVEEIGDYPDGLTPTGRVWVDGKEIWRFSKAGTFAAAANDSIPIPIPASSIALVMPGFPHWNFELAAGFFQSEASSSGAIAAAVVRATSAISITLAGGAQGKDYTLALDFTRLDV